LGSALGPRELAQTICIWALKKGVDPTAAFCLGGINDRGAPYHVEELGTLSDDGP
jgi:hypothetical protein